MAERPGKIINKASPQMFTGSGTNRRGNLLHIK